MEPLGLFSFVPVFKILVSFLLQAPFPLGFLFSILMDKKFGPVAYGTWLFNYEFLGGEEGSCFLVITFFPLPSSYSRLLSILGLFAVPLSSSPCSRCPLVVLVMIQPFWGEGSTIC